MFCMNCGHELPSGAKFCINCGSPKGQMSPSVTTTSNTLNSGKINSSTSANLPKIGDELYFGNDCGSKIFWTVLKQHENQVLIITSDTIHSLPYHRLGSAVMWKECSLRKWLNNTFYNECFSEEERARILLSENVNENNPQFNTRGGVQTSDCVFLLSLNEAEQFFYNCESRANNACWWLRTPGEYQDRAVCVYGDGVIDIYGSFVGGDIGVRPALWLKF